MYNCGVYQILNLINNKRYIGWSANIDQRWHNHQLALIGNYHDNIYLQNAYNLYGDDNFEYSIIEEIEANIEKLLEREIYWIAYYNSYVEDGEGYNLTRGGDGKLGFKFSEESKRKISIGNIGKQSGSANGMYGISISGSDAPMYGKHHSKETKEKISKSRTGIYPSEETRKKLSDARKGYRHSEKSKRKISVNNIGKHNYSEETRRKMSESGKNKIFTKEHRENLSKAKIGKISNRRKNRKENKKNMFDQYRNEDGTFKPEFYDSDYYENGPQSGKGWLENYHWMPRRTFREAFAFIDYLELDENSYVLDVGCAKGFIVRALRELEIPTDGCDISEYALQFAPNGCWNSAKNNSWDEHKNQYTHVIIKDMLEHLTISQLHDMMHNIAKVASKMMVVIPMGDKGLYRIPEYHTEVSHLIAENEGWWRKVFYDTGWKVIKDTNHVPGLKDNWLRIPDGNRVFVLGRMG